MTTREATAFTVLVLVRPSVTETPEESAAEPSDFAEVFKVVELEVVDSCEGPDTSMQPVRNTKVRTTPKQAMNFPNFVFPITVSPRVSD